MQTVNGWMNPEIANDWLDECRQSKWLGGWRQIVNGWLGRWMDADSKWLNDYAWR